MDALGWMPRGTHEVPMQARCLVEETLVPNPLRRLSSAQCAARELAHRLALRNLVATTAGPELDEKKECVARLRTQKSNGVLRRSYDVCIHLTP